LIYPLKWLSFYLYKENYPGTFEFYENLLIYFDKFILKIFETKKVEQIVILGSKFDTRSIRFHKLLKDFEIFELESEEILKQKVESIKSHNLFSSNVHYISIPSFKEIEMKLKENQFQKKKTLWIFENQVPFLNSENQFKNILKLMSSMSSECFILFDFVEKKMFDSPDSFASEG
jgi:O-methyltransferase involved in polyketide biosynthesis